MNIVETLYTGRPADMRTPREERCYDLLDSLGVEYFRVDHEHADTIQDCELVENLLGAKYVKTFFLPTGSRPTFIC